MAQYRVKHTFSSSYVTHVGQVFTDPQWPNIEVLVNQGYLELIGDEAAKPVPEAPVEAEPVIVGESITEAVVESEPEAVEPETQEPAAEPEVVEKEAAKPKKGKKASK